MSILENIKNDKQYKAATGFNCEEFNSLFAVFDKIYTPKESNPYAPLAFHNGSLII